MKGKIFLFSAVQFYIALCDCKRIRIEHFFSMRSWGKSFGFASLVSRNYFTSYWLCHVLARAEMMLAFLELINKLRDSRIKKWKSENFEDKKNELHVNNLKILTTNCICNLTIYIVYWVYYYVQSISMLEYKVVQNTIILFWWKQFVCNFCIQLT